MAEIVSAALLNGQLPQKEQPNHGYTSRIPNTASPSKPTTLSPAPAFLEPLKASQDDNFIAYPPVTPKRPNFSRGLSLQLPRTATNSPSSNGALPNGNRPAPLSPKLDPASTLGSPSSAGSPASVLPRRSRGLDFSRACTNLHHSTLAEQSSPDSSPVIGGKPMMIPRRSGASGPGSPMFPAALWTNMPGGNAERAAMTSISSSIGSVAMADTESDDSSSDEDMMRGAEDDAMHMTPQPIRASLGPFNTSITASPGSEAFNAFSPAAATLRSFRRRQRQGRRTTKSSSSNSGQSSKPSPGPASPSIMHSIELGPNGSYFQKELEKKEIQSRRQSLSLGTHALQISDSMESDDMRPMTSSNDALGLSIPTSGVSDERKPIVRRTVTRRSNMKVRLNTLSLEIPSLIMAQPTTRGFARIRATLQDESTPLDSECRREAEVIRQVRESDVSPPATHRPSLTTNLPNSQAVTAPSSPSLVPTSAHPSEPPSMEDLTELLRARAASQPPFAADATATAPSTFHNPFGFLPRRDSSSFGKPPPRPSISNASDAMSAIFDPARTRTPPPPRFPRGSSSAASEDASMDTPASSIATTRRSSTPQPPPPAAQSLQNGEGGTASATRRTLGKRRRDDDFDPALFKRRAVSPGVSLQNSPVLPPSPATREGWWPGRGSRDTPSSVGSMGAGGGGGGNGERSNSGASNGAGGPAGMVGKRVGMQGMKDANEALMQLGIE